MNLIDEQDVARLQVGENRREVARASDGGSRGGLDLRAHLVCNDRGQRGLTQARGT